MSNSYRNFQIGRFSILLLIVAQVTCTAGMRLLAVKHGRRLLQCSAFGPDSG